MHRLSPSRRSSTPSDGGTIESSGNTRDQANPRLLENLQFFTRLEADSFSRGYGYFRAGSRIAADTGLPRLYIEDTEASQLDAVALSERLLHTLEYSLHRHLGLGFGDPGLANNFVYDIELDQSSLLKNRIGASRLRRKTQLHDKIRFILLSSDVCP